MTDELAASVPTPEPRIDPHVMRVAIVIILGTIMSALDTTIVNVALHDLSGDLNASLGQIQWVITGYLLSLAAVIPVTVTRSSPSPRPPAQPRVSIIRVRTRDGALVTVATFLGPVRYVLHDGSCV